MSNENNKLPLRYVAQFVIEAETPLNVSSGEQDALTDSLIMIDANGLPMIPGTSLAGVLRHAYAVRAEDSDVDSLFGYQGKGNEGAGSRLIISNAHFVGKDGEVIEGVREINFTDSFYAKFAELPIRDHCRISHKGATDADDRGKFDNQVVYKGTRFKFEVELMGVESEKSQWLELLNLFSNGAFRIGGGTRKGYGSIKVLSCDYVVFDLRKSDEIEGYLEKSPKLSVPLPNGAKIKTERRMSGKDWTRYRLLLKPEDFYSFGSGFGDDDADMTPVYEDVIEWNDNIATFAEKKILIPGSSVKGAISHRVAFHYNKLTGVTADGKTTEELQECVGENNAAVKELFGFAKDSKNDIAGERGNVIFSDLFIDNSDSEKILNHVAIDRFTGGAMDGALFNEKVIAQENELELDLLVNNNALQNEKIKEAFEATIDDIVHGLLPLGGSTMRGHGSFNGKWEIKS